jgi:hypothetical protein
MHEYLGTLVNYMRPTITGTEAVRDDEGKIVDRRNVVELAPMPALVVGVEPQPDDAAPRLHLAFLHPDRLAHVSGSGWREAFDRALSVRHMSDPVVIANDNVGYYQDAFYEERQANSRAMAAARGEVARLQSEIAKSTEGRDEMLQKLADAGAKPQLVQPAADQAAEGTGTQAEPNQAEQNRGAEQSQ